MIETKAVAVRYQGNDFFLKIANNEMISLSDLWRGTGMVTSQSPERWLHISETAEFLATCLNTSRGGVLEPRPDPHQGSKMAIRRWAEIIIKECEKQGMIIRTPGKGGGTFASRDIALAYAEYLSPELRSIIIKVYIERVEEAVDPELGFNRYKERALKSWKAMGHDDSWAAVRLKGIVQRNDYTSLLGSRGVRQDGYGDCTNAMYVPLFGGTATELRAQKGLPKSANLRDTLNIDELTSIEFAETLAKLNVREAVGVDPGAASIANQGFNNHIVTFHAEQSHLPVWWPDTLLPGISLRIH